VTAIVVCLVLAVLSGLLVPSTAVAYGSAGGAVHTYNCTHTATTGYPGYAACAARIGDLRTADAQYQMDQAKVSAPSYDFAFIKWVVCDAAATTGNCTFRMSKTLISSGAVTYIDNGLTYAANTRTDQECGGAGYFKKSDGSCYCAPGWVANNDGTCSPATCPSAGVVVPGSAGKTYISSDDGSAGYLGCYDGCLVSGAFGARSESTPPQHMIMGPLVNTGQQCNPSTQGGSYPGLGSGKSDPAAPPVDSCPPPQCPGIVNGTTSCYACGSTGTGNYTKPGPGQDSGGTDTTTTCIDGVCTTTTTTVDSKGAAGQPGVIVTGPGGSNPNSNGTGTGNGDGTCTGSDCQDMPSFCEDNPESPICKDSTWGGTCESSFSCDGDEVQCAIAKEQHMRNCTLFVTQTDMSQKGVDAAKGIDQPVGHPFKDAASTSIDFSSKIDMTNPLGGSCPAGRSVTVAGQSLVIVTAGLCDALAMVGNIIVALGALCSVFIVFKG
jgi:hypothetical protein